MPSDPVSESSSKSLRVQALPPEKRLRAGLSLAAVLLVCLAGWLSWALPLSATETSVGQPSVLFVTADGKPLSRQNFTKADPVDVEKLPPHVVGAVLAIEDRRFWTHLGVDPRAIGRAVLANLRHGGVREGGSTITQQLAKNAFLGPERSLRRKTQEALIALWLEIRLSKEEILSRYLSNVYFGEGVYGLRAAARHYFGKEPEKLALGEAAVLAGMIKAPSSLNPRVAPTKSRDGQAALVALRCDGAVVAMVGGRDYRQSQFNRATQAKRQPGSAFKLFVYLAALRQGARPGDLVTDGPVQVGDWSPGNYEGRYGGEMTLTRAFAQSSNSVAVQLSERAGREAVIRAARDLGVRSPLRPDPSIALGAAETDLLELTSAYNAVRAGRTSRPYGLEGGARRGWSPRLDPTTEQEPLLDMLNAVVERGSGRAARFEKTAYGKTGTTQDHRDALFVGFAGDLTVGVWVGNDDRTPMRGVKGGGLPAAMWRDFMKEADRAGLLETGGCPPLPPPTQAPAEPRLTQAGALPPVVYGPPADPAYGFEVPGPEAYVPPAYVDAEPAPGYYEPEVLPPEKLGPTPLPPEPEPQEPPESVPPMVDPRRLPPPSADPRADPYAAAAPR